jgi:cbb3-type cytochrome c oxidase subunit II
MSPSNGRSPAWQGVALIAVTYIYFLIFAQFAFLKRLASLGIGGDLLKTVMAAMAIGGIFLSLLAPRIELLPSPNTRLRVGLSSCGAIALLTLLPLNTTEAAGISFFIGAGLGLLTVTLVANLRQWVGYHNALLKVGFGTGIGYFVCNFQPLFTASPQAQAATGGVLCLVTACLPLRPVADYQDEPSPTSRHALPFVLVVATFAALVWFDSAAFFIIQNTPLLKAGTWQGSVHLWINAVLHFVAAIVSAILLRSRHLTVVTSASFLALASACLLLLSPDRAPIASVLYPIGVSLYSVALVAYPSLLAPASAAAERGRKAGWIYAIAGWLASVMGIGMAQNLGHVPPVFVLAAGTVVLLPLVLKVLVHRRREILVTAAVLLVSFCISRVLQPVQQSLPQSQVERGRQVYISEGCISCHSQYVRPNTADVLMWGPTESIQELRMQHPPLIGNRRQGPDLSNIGLRRSPLWLRAHFNAPAEVSGASIMPPFGFLFDDRRGDDLVAYLASLHGENSEQHILNENEWQPNAEAANAADIAEGQELYGRYCTTCHSATGRTRLTWLSSFKHVPTDLASFPMRDVSASAPRAQQLIRLDQITKFGIAGTDMPGHECLPDQQIASISLWVLHNSAQPIQNR